MPYESIEAAKTAGFPTTAEGVPLTLPQINKLLELYDAVEAAGTAENPMAVAWTQWKELYVKEGDKWVKRNVESAKSTVLTSAIVGKSDWIPVAAIDQQTTLSLKSGNVTLTISEEALKNHLESWKDGYINVNHEGDGEIEGLKIQDAKFENGMLYHKVSPKVAEFIRNSASSGRSIEVQPLKIIDNKVVEFNGLGLAVLYPPYVPACGPEMGCSSHSSIGGKTMDDKSTAQSAVRDVFTKLAETLKSHSFNDSTNEEAGTDPNLEKTMNEDIEKLTSAKIEAEHGRDEARKEVETLTSSLVEKETALSNKDKTISEQTERLKSYETAEAEAATKLKDDQWEIAKSSIPPGKIHKTEDHDAVKKVFMEDPHGYIVMTSSWQKEDPRGESGAEFTTGDPSSDVEIKKGISAMGIPSITFEGGK